MLADTAVLARDAAQRGQGLAAFNVVLLDHAEAFIDAAQEAQLPLVLQLSQNAVAYHGGRLAPIGRALIELASEATVPVPLVLHGSSGVPDEGMVAAINAGMTKINVSTHLNVVFTSRIRDILLHDPGLVDPRKYVGPATGIVRDEVRRLMELYAGWCAVA